MRNHQSPDAAPLSSLRAVSICGDIAYALAMPDRPARSPEIAVASGAQKLSIRHIPGTEFPIQIVRSDGLPDIGLTIFAGQLLTMLSPGSVRGYLREVLAFINWASTDRIAVAQHWRVFGEPGEVRNLLREYLTAVGECKVLQRPDTLGLRAVYVNVTNDTHINVRLLLAALKKMYEVLADRGRYPFPNPLVHAEAGQAIREFRRGERAALEATLGRPPMPPLSGVDASPADIRLSENYFRLMNREWTPQSIDDLDFPAAVYRAGQAHGWNLRELCAIRMLFESGARISEVFDLTAQDWAASSFTNSFLARSKGSLGRRVKTVLVSTFTAKALRRYFDLERCSCSNGALTVGDLVTLQRREPERLCEIPLFTTVHGRPMTARLFRDHYWKPALRAAGIEADPHQCRHWFVTNALRHLEEGEPTEAELARRKQELIQYMGWHSGERTLKAYEHVQRTDSFARRLSAIHEAMRQRERQAAAATASPARHGGHESAATDRELLFLLGEDHDD
jgi:integrase